MISAFNKRETSVDDKSVGALEHSLDFTSCCLHIRTGTIQRQIAAIRSLLQSLLLPNSNYIPGNDVISATIDFGLSSENEGLRVISFRFIQVLYTKIAPIRWSDVKAAVLTELSTMESAKCIAAALAILTTVTDQELVAFFVFKDGDRDVMSLVRESCHAKDPAVSRITRLAFGNLLIRGWLWVYDNCVGKAGGGNLTEELEGLGRFDSAADALRNKENWIDFVFEVMKICVNGIRGQASSVAELVEDDPGLFEVSCNVLTELFDRYNNRDDGISITSDFARWMKHIQFQDHNKLKSAYQDGKVLAPLVTYVFAELIVDDPDILPFLFSKTAAGQCAAASGRFVGELVLVLLGGDLLTGQLTEFAAFDVASSAPPSLSPSSKAFLNAASTSHLTKFDVSTLAKEWIRVVAMPVLACASDTFSYIPIDYQVSILSMTLAATSSESLLKERYEIANVVADCAIRLSASSVNDKHRRMYVIACGLYAVRFMSPSYRDRAVMSLFKEIAALSDASDFEVARLITEVVGCVLVVSPSSSSVAAEPIAPMSPIFLRPSVSEAGGNSERDIPLRCLSHFLSHPFVDAVLEDASSRGRAIAIHHRLKTVLACSLCQMCESSLQKFVIDFSLLYSSSKTETEESWGMCMAAARCAALVLRFLTFKKCFSWGGSNYSSLGHGDVNIASLAYLSLLSKLAHMAVSYSQLIRLAGEADAAKERSSTLHSLILDINEILKTSISVSVIAAVVDFSLWYFLLCLRRLPDAGRVAVVAVVKTVYAAIISNIEAQFSSSVEGPYPLRYIAPSRPSSSSSSSNGSSGYLGDKLVESQPYSGTHRERHSIILNRLRGLVALSSLVSSVDSALAAEIMRSCVESFARMKASQRLEASRLTKLSAVEEGVQYRMVGDTVDSYLELHAAGNYCSTQRISGVGTMIVEKDESPLESGQLASLIRISGSNEPLVVHASASVHFASSSLSIRIRVINGGGFKIPFFSFRLLVSASAAISRTSGPLSSSFSSSLCSSLNIAGEENFASGAILQRSLSVPMPSLLGPLEVSIRVLYHDLEQSEECSQSDSASLPYQRPYSAARLYTPSHRLGIIQPVHECEGKTIRIELSELLLPYGLGIISADGSGIPQTIFKEQWTRLQAYCAKRQVIISSRLLRAGRDLNSALKSNLHCVGSYCGGLRQRAWGASMIEPSCATEVAWSFRTLCGDEFAVVVSINAAHIARNTGTVEVRCSGKDVLKTVVQHIRTLLRDITVGTIDIIH